MSGWDAGLHRRCVRSLAPNGPNGYSDMGDDDGTGRYYLISSESETVYTQALGTPNQSLPINAGGALSLNWLPGYTVNMLADFYHHPSPAVDAYNWYAFIENDGVGGGPFGAPDGLVTTLAMAADWWTPAGEARVFVLGGFWWDGVPHMVEINLAQTAGWGDGYPDADDITCALPFADTGEYVGVHGPGWGLTLPKTQTTCIAVNWGRVLNTLWTRYDRTQNKHFFTPPQGEVAMFAVGVGMEVLARQVTGAGIAQLWFSGLRTIGTKEMR